METLKTSAATHNCITFVENQLFDEEKNQVMEMLGEQTAESQISKELLIHASLVS